MRMFLYETSNIFNSALMMFRSVPPGESWVTGFGDASAELKGMAPLDWTLRYVWPSLPGRFVEFRETAAVVLGIGDAKAFYDYVPGHPDLGELI